jgi:predicted kinase
VSTQSAAALHSELRHVRTAPPATINTAAYALGQLVTAGLFPRDLAEQTMTAAGRAIGLGTGDRAATFAPAVPAAPVLVVLVGPAGSGKSTLARAYFRRTEVVATDELRARVADDESDLDATGDAVAVLHQLVTIRLARRLRTVVDATNVERPARASLLSIAAAHRVEAHAVVLTTPLPVCLARNATRSAVPRPGCRYARQVREPMLVAQHAAAMAAAPVLAAEGFARVDLVDASDPGREASHGQ